MAHIKVDNLRVAPHSLYDDTVYPKAKEDKVYLVDDGTSNWLVFVPTLEGLKDSKQGIPAIMSMLIPRDLIAKEYIEVPHKDIDDVVSNVNDNQSELEGLKQQMHYLMTRMDDLFTQSDGIETKVEEVYETLESPVATTQTFPAHADGGYVTEAMLLKIVEVSKK